MCGRFAMDDKVNAEITEFVEATGRRPEEWTADWEADYNIAPTDDIPVLIDSAKTRELRFERRQAGAQPDDLDAAVEQRGRKRPADELGIDPFSLQRGKVRRRLAGIGNTQPAPVPRAPPRDRETRLSEPQHEHHRPLPISKHLARHPCYLSFTAT